MSDGDATERLREAVRWLDECPDRSAAKARRDADAAIDALEAEVERLTRERDEARAEVVACARSQSEADDAIEQLDAEVERLREVLRWTHDTYCSEAYTDRGLHAPGCLLYEVEAADE